MRTAKGYLLLGAAFVLCPCHLPLLAALLAGTAVGGFLAANTAVVLAAGTVGFLGALLVGLRALNEASLSPRSCCEDGVETVSLARSDAAPSRPRPAGVPRAAIVRSET